MRFAVNRIRKCIAVSRVVNRENERAVGSNRAACDGTVRLERESGYILYLSGKFTARCACGNDRFNVISAAVKLFCVIVDCDLCVAVCRPHSLERKILRRHCFGNFGSPARKCIAFLRRCCGSNNLFTVLKASYLRFAAVVGVKGRGVGVCLICYGYGYVVCGHCARNGCGVGCKALFFGRSNTVCSAVNNAFGVRVFRFRAVLINILNGERIGIYAPLRLYRDVFGGYR